MNKIRVLGIAPYEGMRALLNEQAANWENIELTVYVGDLDEGVRIVKSLSPTDYDVMISRGGTAELLREHSALPIIEVTLSVYDVLRTLWLVQDFSGRHAIVGFQGITDSAYILRNLLQTHIDVVTLHSSDEVESLLHELKDSGYQMIIGDMVTCNHAQRLGMDSILITSGAESIGSAFAQAVRYCQFNERLRQQNQLMRTLLRDSRLAVLDSSGNLVFDTLPKDADGLLSALRKEQPNVQKRGAYAFTRSSRDKSRSYQVFASPLDAGDGDAYAAFSVQPEDADEYGVTFHTAEQIERETADSFYISRLNSMELQSQLERAMRQPLPLIFIGEEGIGKESLAHLLYLRGECRSQPMTRVDCAVIQEKGWRYLFTHLHSPLNGEGRMIVFSHCERMEEKRQRQLMPFLESSGLCARNKVIFSFTGKQGEAEASLFRRLTETCHALTTRLPPLRQTMGNVNNLVSLSINSLNVTLGKQIIGMDAASITLVRQYDWPGNYRQFQRVLTQIMLATDSDYISETTTREMLHKESAQWRTDRQSESTYDLSLTLAEQSRDYARVILAQEAGNQSRAAKRLNVSRSTLWRMLKADG